MKVVWEKKTATVREVYEALRERKAVAYTTVSTMMNILETKGHLVKQAEGRAYVYEPSQARTQVISGMVQEFRRPRLRRRCPGAAPEPDQGAEAVEERPRGDLSPHARRRRTSHEPILIETLLSAGLAAYALQAALVLGVRTAPAQPLPLAGPARLSLLLAGTAARDPRAAPAPAGAGADDVRRHPALRGRDLDRRNRDARIHRLRVPLAALRASSHSGCRRPRPPRLAAPRVDRAPLLRGAPRSRRTCRLPSPPCRRRWTSAPASSFRTASPVR